MIISNLTGGLGNQMFQYAVGRNLALKCKTNLKLHFTNALFNTQRSYALDIFNIHAELARRTDIQRVGALSNRIANQLYFMLQQKIHVNLLPHVYIEKHFPFDQNVFALPDNTYVQGFWTHENYFKEIRTILQNDFKIKKPINERNKMTANIIRSTHSVSVHVRRGDYVNNPLNKKLNKTNTSYYMKGIKKIASKVRNIHIFMFSDDIIWCKQNLKFSHPVIYIDFNKGKLSHWDMYLMSLCKHNIIANSSFSWWASWLNQNPKKIIISPNKNHEAISK